MKKYIQLASVFMLLLIGTSALQGFDVLRNKSFATTTKGTKLFKPATNFVKGQQIIDFFSTGELKDLSNDDLSDLGYITDYFALTPENAKNIRDLIFAQRAELASEEGAATTTVTPSSGASGIWLADSLFAAAKDGIIATIQQNILDQMAANKSLVPEKIANAELLRLTVSGKKLSTAQKQEVIDALRSRGVFGTGASGTTKTNEQITAAQRTALEQACQSADFLLEMVLAIPGDTGSMILPGVDIIKLATEYIAAKKLPPPHSQKVPELVRIKAIFDGLSAAEKDALTKEIAKQGYKALPLSMPSAWA